MGSTTIRLSEEAKERLDRHRRDGETYDDVVLRLTERDRWAAFGIADGDATDGHQRVRDAARRRSDERVDGYRE